MVALTGAITIGGNVQLITQHLHQSIHSSLVEAEGTLELDGVQHLHVVSSLIIHHQLSHQLHLHPRIKLLNIFNLQKMPLVQ